MSKAILISVKPKWVAKILNGEKTIEIRKTKPNVELPIDVYIYVSKNDGRLYQDFSICKEYIYDKGVRDLQHWVYNGKVVAKFTLNKVEEISYTHLVNARSYFIKSCSTARWFEQDCCLETWEIDDYLKGKTGYAWHISNLEVFDKPRELGEFAPYYITDKSKYISYPICDFRLAKAPQSYQFIEVGE